MSSKVLLDTNVMLDLALARPEGFDAAATIAEAVAYEEVVAYVCATSLKDLYYILSKAMGEKHARTYIKAVMDDFIICSVDYALCRQAADSDEPDFEDGLVRAAPRTPALISSSRETLRRLLDQRCARSLPADYVARFLVDE